jgi:hypothetical protein
VLTLGCILHTGTLAPNDIAEEKAHDALPVGDALIVYERFIDDERCANAPALLASLNMLIMTAGGFDFTGSDCESWMRDAGFHHVRVEPLMREISMVTRVK